MLEKQGAGQVAGKACSLGNDGRRVAAQPPLSIGDYACDDRCPHVNPCAEALTREGMHAPSNPISGLKHNHFYPTPLQTALETELPTGRVKHAHQVSPLSKSFWKHCQPVNAACQVKSTIYISDKLQLIAQVHGKVHIPGGGELQPGLQDPRQPQPRGLQP